MQPLSAARDQSAKGLAVTALSVLTVVISAWTVAVTLLAGVGGWVVNEAILEVGQFAPRSVGKIAGIILGLSVALPSGVLLRFAKRRVRHLPGAYALLRALRLAGSATAFISFARAIPAEFGGQFWAAGAAIAIAVGSSFFGDAPANGRRRRSTQTLLAGAVGTLTLLPWLWAGALGGGLETMAAASVSLGGAWLAASLLNVDFFAGFNRSRARLVGLGGLSAGVTLAPIAWSLGGPAIGPALILIIPSLGFTLAALAASKQGLPPRLVVLTVIAPAAFGPLAFVDPNELTLVLGLEDVAKWALIATMCSTAIALLLGLGLAVALRPSTQSGLEPRQDPEPGLVPHPEGELTPRLARRPGQFGRRLVAPLLAVAIVGAPIVVYAGTGHPGFYGDQLFVIFKEQANLAGLRTISDRGQRLAETYQRLVTVADRSQAPLRSWLDESHVAYRSYYLVNAILVDAGPQLLRQIRARAEVDRVLTDQRLRPLPMPGGQEITASAEIDSTNPQWNIKLIKADQAWSKYGVTGSGIVIGTSDSGVDGAHPAVSSQFRGGTDSWLDPWNGSVVPTDHNGHGTHTIGTVLGAGGIGVAPGAQWMGCVNLDRNLGSPSHYLDCLQFMLAPYRAGGDPLRDGQPTRAAHILTNSWGCPPIEGCDPEALAPAVAAIRAAGIFFSVSAGNSGPGCDTITDPPAPDPNAFTTGAIDSSGQVAPFSSRGPDPWGKPDILAPGVNVVSSVPGGGYAALDGTSMASPHVAATVALMWQANPALIGDIDATEKILRASPTQIAGDCQVPPGPSAFPRWAVSIPILDAYSAVTQARALIRP